MSINTYCLEEIYINLIKNFCKGSLKFSLQPEEIKHMSWNWQEKFLDTIFNSGFIKKYPVNYKFSILFLKKILSYIENNQEVHDDFYTQLCVLMSNEADQHGFCYRHYIIGNDLNNIMTIKETKNMVVNGTTGMKTWEAAFVLSDWALCNKELFKTKKVLELGSGVGFTGVTISKLCKPSLFMFTDCHNDVLKSICGNIQINLPQFIEDDQTVATYFKGEGSTLGVMMLDWNDSEDFPENIVPDVIIGADIVYDPVILEPLCNVIGYFYHRNKHLKVFIASVIRNEDTFAAFLRTLETKHFIFEEIILPTKSLYVDWDHSTKVCLLKIKRSCYYGFQFKLSTLKKTITD